MWLMGFLEHMMGILYDDKNATLSHAAKEAYNKALGPNHPWVVR